MMAETIAYCSRIDVPDAQYESFLTADGASAGDVAWLRSTENEGRTYKAGMWRCGVSECPYYFAAHETFVMIEGTLQVKLEDGTTLTFGPGDTASFEIGTNSTWTVIEPVLHFFIQTT